MPGYRWLGDLSVDQLNDLGRSRATLGASQVLLGNVDPVGVLANGTVREVSEAVSAALDSGVNAVWPGCDLVPDVPADNMIAMVEATRRQRPEPSEPSEG